VPISGLKLTIPKGLEAEEKKNHLELAESIKGFTKSTGDCPCNVIAYNKTHNLNLFIFLNF
tara:strand:- start:79 stop:261 length:183 start_codon:yes stop_codon:yes gene_type:complete